MWCRVLLAPLVVAAASLVPATYAHAAATPHCVSGPCRQPEGVDVTFGSAPAQMTPTALANFGLLLSTGSSPPAFDFVCEESFGGAVPERIRMDARGRIFMPSRAGLFMSDDGCVWERPAGALATVEVFDVVLDPRTPDKVWALSGQPRVLSVSIDGGRTFAPRYTFGPKHYLRQLALAPSNPDVVYVSGYGDKAPFVLALSNDAGVSFAVDEAARPATASGEVVAFLGVAPDSPHTVYLALQQAEGDEIWKSTMGGRDPVKMLTLESAGAVGGFAFGASARTLYVAGRSLVFTEGLPTARLYISRDGGGSWEAPVLSGPRGPFLRCLSHRGGTLYACGAGTSGDDEYLIGASSDEGRTWRPVIRMSDLRAARSCVAATCAATTNWLCENHGVCSGRLDAGTDAGGSSPDVGCGCDVGAGAREPGGLALGLLALTTLALRTRQQRRAPARARAAS